MKPSEEYTDVKVYIKEITYIRIEDKRTLKIGLTHNRVWWANGLQQTNRLYEGRDLVILDFYKIPEKVLNMLNSRDNEVIKLGFQLMKKL